MATRSNIAYKTAEGKIRSIYCHWDGYVANNGKILLENYTDQAKIEALVALGSLSSLGEELGEQQDFDDRSSQKDSWCLAYGRDRGEVDVEAREYDSIPDWIDDMEEYAYLWNGQDWLVNDHGATAGGFPVFDLLSTVVPIEVARMEQRIAAAAN